MIHGCLPKMVFLHNRDIYIMNHDKHVYFLLLLNIGHLSFKNSMKHWYLAVHVCHIQVIHGRCYPATMNPEAACTAVPVGACHWWRMIMAVDDRYILTQQSTLFTGQSAKNGWHSNIFQVAMLDHQRERGNYSSPRKWIESWFPMIPIPMFGEVPHWPTICCVHPIPGAAGCEQVRFEGGLVGHFGDLKPSICLGICFFEPIPSLGTKRLQILVQVMKRWRIHGAIWSFGS